MPRSLKIGADGDLEFTHGSPRFVAGADSRAQRLRSRLRTIRGEWFLDETIGLPMEKSEATLAAEVRGEAEAVEEIASVTDITVTVDRANREATVTLTAVSSDGTLLEVEA